MLGNLDEIAQNNLIKDYELKEIITTLTEIGIKPLKFLGIYNDFVAIETREAEQCQNRQTLITNNKNISADMIDKIVKSSCQSCYISQQRTQKYEIIHIPSAKYTLNDQNIHYKFKDLDKKSLIEIFTRILYVVISMQKDDDYYLGINKDSIFFKRNGQVFLNQFNFKSIDKIKHLIQNMFDDEFLMYLPPEILQNSLYKSSSDIYTLGLFFLEILGLQIDKEVALQLSNSNYQITNCLKHQDLVSIITQYMICQDYQKRSSSIDLFWLFKFQLEEKLNIQEICMFIQSNIQLNKNVISEIQNSSKNINRSRIISEYKIFDNLIDLEYYYQNGCIVTSLKECNLQILIFGNELSEFENKYMTINIELESGYPYKSSPLIQFENGINSILCGQNNQILQTLNIEWSPATTIKAQVITVASIFNKSANDIISFFYCEDNLNEMNSQLLSEELKKLGDVDILYNQYKSQFLQKYAK
ncbi:ubiquitin-conjugating enzyme (macronuclear) [Tetrahymena thermophila SB210]|uniref:Ubiquitin-conjugating enzyme n=1 Tax=Tetrahymena thermophila (strain SB210) TaxID=312017 RepID=I7M5Z0_TETTS|nr:ubiquitin-conjugating enzyme [Tetrahymena thermophila SB210]EAR83838.2 ubiquitin-conjugating enzyme [Tetrahymena thermophila SB210]|eukprot:XP_001031501.2 ubiquitin-conjugating enzyme [Tetrahymena thermophila SB210]